MRFMVAILVFALGLSASAHAADQAQAKEVARINNCTPKKVDVYQQTLGVDGKTIYHVDCTMPKSTNESAASASALLISCDESICELLRSVPPDAEKK